MIDPSADTPLACEKKVEAGRPLNIRSPPDSLQRNACVMPDAETPPTISPPSAVTPLMKNAWYGEPSSTDGPTCCIPEALVQRNIPTLPVELLPSRSAPYAVLPSAEIAEGLAPVQPAGVART